MLGSSPDDIEAMPLSQSQATTASNDSLAIACTNKVNLVGSEIG